MKIIKKIVLLFLNITFFQKLLAYWVLLLWFYFLRDFLLVLFLTFLFSYLFLTLWTYLKLHLDNLLEKIIFNKSYLKYIKKIFSLNIIIIILYLTFVTILFFALSDLLPKLTKELKEIPKYVPAISSYVDVIASKLEEMKNINSQIWWSISEIFTKQDLDIAIEVYEKLKTVWAIFFKIILSLILSYIFIIDRDKLWDYLKWIKSSNFWFFYKEYKMIIWKIVRTFGLVFKAQSMIALVNTVLTTIWLIIIGLAQWFTFPFIYTLAIVVFICWFIPVIGTFISSIPILIIWYTLWWITIVFQVVFLIAFIHALEAYYLNPKIVSSFIHLPVSLTFLVLILSEYFMWIAWLVIWVSTFYLIIELLKDVDVIINKSKIKFEKLKDKE